MPTQENNNSQFFIVKHEFVSDENVEKFWSQQQGMTSEDWALKSKVHEEHGFHSHSYMPISRMGPIFCVWEGKPGTKLEDFSVFINSKDTGFDSIFVNEVWPIDNTLLSYHGHTILCAYDRRRFGGVETDETLKSKTELKSQQSESQSSQPQTPGF